MILWEHILRKLRGDQKVYLLTVIQNTGSSPGRKGFKMIVSQDGFIYGSVGGGIMEFTLVEEAKQLLIENTPPTFIKKQIHKGHIKNGSGMICSGEQTVAFHPLSSVHISVIESILNGLMKRINGSLNLTSEVFEYSTKSLDQQFNIKIDSNEDWSYEESLLYRETLYIIGGGHVGVAVSELFVKLGFYVIVFDNRAHLNTLENNNFAHQKSVIDYNDIAHHIPTDDCYIAIMTNKYTDDRLIVSKLVKRNFTFMGVLGSKAKIKTMWKDLIKVGHTKTVLDKIHAPIGLSIKSETPEEIAVSIAAQIIQIKNLGKK